MLHRDQVYITALLENNKELIDEIYKKYSGKIQSYVLKNNGTVEEAKDLFQEGLLSIYSRSKKGNFELKCPFEAYLFLVCRSKWLNILKSSKKKKETFFDIEQYNFKDAESLSKETTLMDQKLIVLEKNLQKLGEGCQKVLKESWNGSAMEDVAKVLNITYGYARKKKSECIAKLIKLVKSDNEFKNLLP